MVPFQTCHIFWDNVDGVFNNHFSLINIYFIRLNIETRPTMLAMASGMKNEISPIIALNATPRIFPPLLVTCILWGCVLSKGINMLNSGTYLAYANFRSCLQQYSRSFFAGTSLLMLSSIFVFLLSHTDSEPINSAKPDTV